MRELPRIVADTPPGDSVDVIVMRDGQRVTLKIEVGRLQDEKVTAVSTGDSDEEASRLLAAIEAFKKAHPESAAAPTTTTTASAPADSTSGNR